MDTRLLMTDGFWLIEPNRSPNLFMTPTPVDQAAIQLLFQGQPGYLLLCNRDRSKWCCDPLPDALARWPEWDYFGIVPRTHGTRGSKDDIVSDVWSLWVDVDDAEGLNRLLSLHQQNLGPTFILHSGKGFWGHWRLSDAISKHMAETLNRRLAVLVGGADSCHNVDRIARLPGAVHKETGVISSVLEMSGQIHDPALLDGVLPAIPAAVATPIEIALVPLPGRNPTPKAKAVIPGMLGFMQRSYILSRPTRDQAKARGVDRSEVEWGIAKELLRYGLLADDTLSWFNHYALARHSEEYAKRTNYSWTINLIAKAQVVVDEEVPTYLSSSLVVETLHQPPRRKNARVDRVWLVRYVYDHQPLRYTDLVKAIVQRCGCSTSAAKENIRLGRELNILDATDAGYILTEEGVAGAMHEGFVTGAPRIAAWARYIRKQPRRSVAHRPAGHLRGAS
jgi:hypothetical protein